MANYRTTPEVTEKMPAAVPYIMANEVAERYAFYSLMGILAVFLHGNVKDFSGNEAHLSEEKVTEYVSWFQSACYLAPLAGSLISDIFLGKYKTIILFSLVYIVGFVFITLDQGYLGVIIGLALIATGTGVIKPCVSANVGDQFGHTNKNLITRAYNLFYWSVNIGATLSMFLAPLTLKYWGPRWAMGIPGGFMAVATVFYWLGRNRLTHIPPKGFNSVKKTLTSEGLVIIIKLFFFLYLFVAIFWSLFNQTMSKWVLQAQQMDLTFFRWNFDPETFPGNLLSVLHCNSVNWHILPEQIQAVNSLMVVLAIPVFTYVVYPLINKVFTLTPLRKVAIGFFIATPSFIIPAILEKEIGLGHTPSCWWQVLAYAFITAGEVMISIPALEFSYTQAPKEMKSFISSLNLVSVSVGSIIIAVINKFIQNPDGTVSLQGPDYYWFFTWLFLGAGILFCVVSPFYRGKTYIQDE